MSLYLFLLYTATWLLVALTPGPAVMCSMAQATRHGFRSSLAGIAGIQTGNLVFFICVALGLGALLTRTAAVFDALRILGAVYLFYVGLRLIVSTRGRAQDRTDQPITTLPSRRGLFLQGLLIQLTNPKALLFVSALVPQFLEPGGSVVPQLFLLGMATLVVDTVVLSAYAWMAGAGARSFRRSRWVTWLERALGATLVWFGFRLLLARDDAR